MNTQDIMITKIFQTNYTQNKIDITLSEALDEIKSGKYKDKIVKARELSAKEYTQYKTGLVSYAFAGTFMEGERVLNSTFSKSSGIFHGDIDHLEPADLVDMIAKLKVMPGVIFAFVSPSGNGIKFGIRISNDIVKTNNDQKKVFTWFREELLKDGIDIDESCKDLRRLCFTSYDPDLYYDSDAEIVELPPLDDIVIKVTKKTKEGKFLEYDAGEGYQPANDPLLEVLYSLGMVKGEVEPGIHAMICPWKANHTDGIDNYDARYFEAHTNKHDKANFKCHHSHCQDKKIWSLTEKFKEQVEAMNKIPLLEGLYAEMETDDPLEILRGMAVKVETLERLQEMKVAFPNLLTEGSVTILFASPESGKTQLARFIAGECAKSGYEVFYVDLDSPANVVKEMVMLSLREGWRYINPEMEQGQTIEKFNAVLDQLADSSQDLYGKVIIFDTVKKFADMIDKRQLKTLMSRFRKLANKGVAILGLSHTNKYSDKDLVNGKTIVKTPVFEGTGDLSADSDSMLSLISHKDKEHNRMIFNCIADKEINHYVKNRFGYDSFSGEIVLSPTLEGRKVTIHSEIQPIHNEEKIAESKKKTDEALKALFEFIAGKEHAENNYVRKEICQKVSDNLKQFGVIKMGRDKLIDVLTANTLIVPLGTEMEINKTMMFVRIEVVDHINKNRSNYQLNPNYVKPIF